MMIDISIFYLSPPLKRPEYLRVKLSDVPREIIKQYNLHAIAKNKVFDVIKVTNAMCSLPQAGILANELLEK